jgi:hypothetical protein
MADFERGIKAGVITGAIYLAIALILAFTLASQHSYASGVWDAAGLAYLPLGGQIIRGIIFGAVLAALYGSLPGRTGVVKAVVLSSFLWVSTVIQVTYTNLSWPWQAAALDGATYYGGTINLSSVNFTLISIMSALVFGVLTGLLWNRFRGKEPIEERKGREVLLVSFILGSIFWGVIGGTYIRFFVIGLPFPRVLFFSWYAILHTLVLFGGLLGWIFAVTAWRKAGRRESGLGWGLAGGVIMVVSGLMLLPGALAITGGVFSRHMVAGEPRLLKQQREGRS